MKQAIRCILCVLLLLQGAVGLAQVTGSGDIRGTVTDDTGAVIPGAAITVLNVDTGVSKTYTADSAGLYDTSAIVAGSYKLTFSKEGFGQLVRGPITLQVGITTVNAQLNVGSVSEQVVVHDDIPLLQTESHEQSTTLDSKTMQELPQVGQDWENFTVLLPGAVGTSSGGNASNPGQNVSVNGNLPYSNFLADGSSTTLVNSGNTDVSIFETVAELQVNTSSFSAEYGVGGVVFNQISKGGTSKYHGSAYEYWQNDALNASNYGFGNNVPVPFLRFNNFGGSIGGPILKKKAFFFFDFDKTINNAVSTYYATIPTAAEQAGDFTGEPLIYDPTTQVVTQTGTLIQGGVSVTCPCVTRTSFADEYHHGNKIPQALLAANPVSQAVQALYADLGKGYNVPGTLQPNGQLQNNRYVINPSPSPFIKYFGRLDYDIKPNNRLTISDTQRDSNSPQTGNVFAAPYGYYTQDIDSNNAQISDVWNISPRLVNEARFGYTDQLNFFADQTLNKGYAAKLGWQFPAVDEIPSIGAGPYATLQPGQNAILKEFTYAPSDVVTLIRGKHILKFGGEFLMYQNNATQWDNIQPGDFSFSGYYTQEYAGNSGTGAAYADFLLGAAQSWYAQYVPEYGARYKTPQMFAQDDFKVKPNFTLNLGVRYTIQHGWSEKHNNIATFDPTVLNPGTGTLGAIWYASAPTYNRHSLEATIWDDILPRVGFAWTPKPDTTVRGGYGLYVYNYSIGRNAIGMGLATQSTGYEGEYAQISPVVNLSSNGAGLQYGPVSTTPDSQNYNQVDYEAYNSPDIKIAQWNVAVQHSFLKDYVAQLSYVASHGYNMLFPVDINQVPEADLAYGPNNSQYRPYPIYATITSSGGSHNGISNYNSLQASVTKRLTSGFSLNFNYVWSHFLDEQDTSAWANGNAGSVVYQRSYDPRANYGASNLDVRNAFKGYAVYQLPFGIGKQFLNSSHLLDTVIGGWQLSGTVVLESGNPYTAVIDQNNSYSQSSNNYWYPNVLRSPKLSHPNINTGWFDPTAFASPLNGAFGNERRNSLYGPGLSQFNLTGGKTFSIAESVKLKIRADASNVLNHPSFSTPNAGLYCPTPGAACSASTTNITGVTVGGRTMQLGAHLAF
jgi:hypothetical protein